MRWRGYLYCAVIVELIVGCLALVTVATMEPGGWLKLLLRGAGFRDEVGAGMAVIFAGGIGLIIIVVQPFFGLIYRYDRATFEDMLKPGYRAPRNLRPLPPLGWPVVRQQARVAAGLGAGAAVALLAAGGLRLLGTDGPAWAGLALGLGLWLGAALLAGGRLFLWLRDTAP